MKYSQPFLLVLESLKESDSLKGKIRIALWAPGKMKCSSFGLAPGKEPSMPESSRYVSS